jgi:A/G-specific adenine glycosylase
VLIETETDLTENPEAFVQKLQGVLKKQADVFLKPVRLGVKHVLSHRVIHANFYELVLPEDFGDLEGYQKVAMEELHKFAVSNLVYQFFSLILKPNNQKI